MSAAGVKRISLKDLTIESCSTLLVGIIIAKRSPRTFISKKDGSERGVWGFTFRDSPVDYINVTVWGFPSYVSSLSSSYSVGDVVDLINCKVALRRLTETEDNYQPPVTSCYELSFNEELSEICFHDGDDVVTFKRLLYLPTKPPGNFLTLQDVNLSYRTIANQYVDLLVAVHCMTKPREVKGRDGQSKQVLEISVMDQTFTGFILQAWDQETINRAKAWKPRTTVLFVSDVRVNWDSYRKMMRGTICDRTVVTVSPQTREATILSHYCQTAPITIAEANDNFASSFTNPETINNVMSCYAVATKAVSQETIDNFTALVYGTIEMFDLDGDLQVVVFKCSQCNFRADEVCVNNECPSSSSGAMRTKLLSSFDIRISIADHTGCLNGCRLTGSTAVNLLNIKSEEYIEMGSNEKIYLKWKYLFKLAALRLLVKPVSSSNDRQTPIISIVDIKIVSFQEYVNKIPPC